MYNIVDRIFIGHIPEVGSIVLTGIGVCMPVTLIISSFAQLVGIGGTPKASMFMGKNKSDIEERILGTCTFGLIVVSVILTAIGMNFSKKILVLFGASENTLPYSLEYMQIYIYGTIFVELTIGLVAFTMAQGFTIISMKIVITGAVLNIILDPVFMFGFGMETRGSYFSNYYLTGNINCISICFSMWEKDYFESTKKIYKVGYKTTSPVFGVRTFSLLYGIDRMFCVDCI